MAFKNIANKGYFYSIDFNFYSDDTICMPLHKSPISDLKNIESIAKKSLTASLERNGLPLKLKQPINLRFQTSHVWEGLGQYQDGQIGKMLEQPPEWNAITQFLKSAGYIEPCGAQTCKFYRHPLRAQRAKPDHKTH